MSETDDILHAGAVAALQRWLARPDACLTQQEGLALCDALTAAWAERDAARQRADRATAALAGLVEIAEPFQGEWEAIRNEPLARQWLPALEAARQALADGAA